MARRAITADVQEPISAEFDDVSAQVEDDYKEENEIAAEFGVADGDTHFMYKVWRYIPLSKDFEYCFEGTVADLPLIPKLQKEWGGGKYRVQVYKNGKYYRRYMPVVASPPIAPQQLALAATPQTGNDPAVIALLQKLIEKQEAQQPTRMGVGEIVAIIGAAAPILTTLKTLFAPPQNNQLDTVVKVLEVAAQFQGGGSDREPTILETIAKVVTNPELMQTIGGALQPQQAQIVTPQIAPPQQPKPQPSKEQMDAAIIRQQLAMLVTRAQKSSDPGLYAELLIDSVEPAMLQQLAAPGALALIEMLHPPCATYRPWFEALLTSLQEQLQESEPGGESEASPLPDAPSPDFGGAAFGAPQPVFAPNPADENVQPAERDAGGEGDVEFDGAFGEGGEGQPTY